MRRRRDKNYLKKLCYMRNFLNLLQMHRIFLSKCSWKFRKRLKSAIEWPICSKPSTVITISVWSFLKFYQIRYGTTVIFYYYNFQLTMKHDIKLPHLFSFNLSPIEKVFKITLRRQEMRQQFLIVAKTRKSWNLKCS